MIIPVVAAVIVDNKKYGRVLLTKHGECECQGGCGLEDRFEFPGGKVEDGESLEDALLREVWEELEIELCGVNSSYPPKVIHAQINKYDHSPNYYLVIYFESYTNGNIDEGKLPDHRWVELDDIRECNPLPGSVEALRNL